MTGPAASSDAGPQGGFNIEYELDDWAVESRQMLRQLLVGHDIAHVWEAGRLVVAEEHEDLVDNLVDQVAATFAGTLDDPEVPRVVFDVSDIDPGLLDDLTLAIGDAGIDWVVESDGTLVVPAEHTVDVERLVERLEFPHALELSEASGADGATPGDAPDGGSGPDDGGVDNDGIDIDPDRVLGGLFVACDRLSRSATDPRGVMSVIELSDELAAARVPFGIDPGRWENLQELASALAGLLGDLASTDEQIEQAALSLRQQLRSYV